MLTKEAWGNTKRDGPEKVGFVFVVEGWVEVDEAGMPWVWSRERMSDLGRSKPRALRATFSSW